MAEKKNNTCHWCRVSKNRKRKIERSYISCDLCNKIYCEICIREYPDIFPGDLGCLFCQNLCCCTGYCFIKDTHKCCFNARRSRKKIVKAIPVQLVDAIIEEI